MRNKQVTNIKCDTLRKRLIKNIEHAEQWLKGYFALCMNNCTTISTMLNKI